MLDKQTEHKARKLLPDPTIFDGNYIDIEVPSKNGMHDVVTFAKQLKGDEVIWLALPYAR